MTTAQLPRIHCFRAGRHTAMSGVTLDFSDADLAASAAAYDPDLYRAPIVVGHPAIDAPAYAWVSLLTAEGEGLFAEADQVEVQFAELVRHGRYKKVSASWFPPAHPRNPVPGVYYLKHLGFLGAAAPAVPGLKPVEFADDGDCVTLEFAWGDTADAGLWQRLREWIASRFGLDEADRAIPVSAGATGGRPEDLSPPRPSPRPFDKLRTNGRGEGSNPLSHEGDDDMTPEQQARLDALVAENDKLKADAVAAAAQFADFADREAALAAKEDALLREEIADFAEGLVSAGRVLPRDREALVAYLSGEAEIAFAEGEGAEGAVKRSADAWLRSFLTRLPVQVDFAERGAALGSTETATEFAAPDNYPVDAAALDLHRRAVTHQKAHPGTDYLSAVKAVSNP